MAEDNISAPQEDLSEILKIRRDKLAALTQEGNDPFLITKFDRTALSGDIKADFESFENKTVSLAGRIMAKRGMWIFYHKSAALARPRNPISPGANAPSSSCVFLGRVV
ncbi:MAG: hypothetical protein II794_04705 [Oscillospiraceae bacterium]|nr:hypothetical protein [Oscillospiraceae bacterium]